MSKVDKVPFWAFALAILFGLALIAYAVVSGSSWAALIGMLGLILAGKSAITLARRSGATDQPQ